MVYRISASWCWIEDSDGAGKDDPLCLAAAGESISMGC